MISQNFQEAYAQISEIGSNLLLYLREFRQGKLAEGDDTQGLQSVEETIIPHSALQIVVQKAT